MSLKAFLLEEDRGVSPVIGVILMVAITVILAAVIATFVMNMGPPEDQAPTASWDTSHTDAGQGDEVTFEHDGGGEVDGEELVVVVSDANNPGSPGSATVDGRYQWVDDLGGDSTVSATSSVTLSNNTMLSNPTGNITDFDDATIELVWESGSSDKSQVLKTWEP